MAIDRRSFLRIAAAAGVGLPWLACAPGRGAGGTARAGPFRHGVASGDPLADRVVLWTRVSVATPDPVAVQWRLARDPGLRDEVARGRVTADPSRDHTVKVDPTGLEPATSYYYRFEAAGHASPIGRTRTLPVGEVERLRFAFASCANIAFGYFNVYALIARRPDLDAVLHLGDYLYEYANATYGDGSALGRAPRPDRELLTLADYRTRHAQYKGDPDLQEAHRQHPFIAVWDDHESANNAWKDGAQNHDPASEGDWAARKASAMRAWREWMPIREGAADGDGRIYRRFRCGDLADLLMLDTRLVGRDRQARSGHDVETLRDPGRSLLGPAQEAWLLDALSDSQASGVGWRVLGQQVMFAQLVHKDGTIRNPDQWDGYPASRARLLDQLERGGIDDMVVLTGDLHSSWALEISRDPFAAEVYDPATGRGSLAVEFVVPAVSSPGERDPERAARRAAETLARHPHLRWLDLYHRGYGLLDLDRERAQAEWWHVDTVSERRRAERFAKGFRTRRGRSHLEPVVEPSAPRAGAPPLAPWPERVFW